MPWSNQGGGPWGSGAEGPLGLGTATVRARRRPTSKSCCGAARTSCKTCCRAAISAARASPSIAARGARDLGLLRLLPGGARRARRRDALRQVRARCQPGPQLSPALSDRVRADAEGHRASTASTSACAWSKTCAAAPPMRDVPEESLMLTGDENIVDVDFSVFWGSSRTACGDYLFNIQKPEGTVKAVAESAMREVVGRSNIQPILTGARQNIEDARAGADAEDARQYSAGIQVTQVQLQKVDPPAQVIDSFRDVQAARADLERAAERGADLRQPGGAGGARPRRADHAGAPKPIASRRSPRRRARPRASSRSMTSTRRRRTSPASASISRPWSGCSAAPTRSSWIPGTAAARASCPICRSTN